MVLIICAVLFLGLVGLVLGMSFGVTPWGGLAVAVIIGVILSAVAWGQGSAIMKAASGAHEIKTSDDPELINIVEELTIASGLPMPRVYVIDSSSMNAFATGTNPDKAAVAVTRGLRKRLTREELQGVMAHEMAHIGNYDTRIMVLLGVIVGSVAIMSDMFLRGTLYGGRRKGKGGAILLVIAVLLAILAPLFAMLIQLAVSRKREYLADATGAAMTRNPGALADALEKLSGSSKKLEVANRGTQHMFIINPFRLRQKANSPMATHPPIAERIRRLRKLAGATG